MEATFKSPIKPDKFWMVWRYGTNAPTFVHHSESSAVYEAERLAQKHPDDVFYVMESVKEIKASRSPVVIIDL